MAIHIGKIERAVLVPLQKQNVAGKMTATENVRGMCNRMRKECIRQAPVHRKQRIAKSTRVAQLESKLDSIVTLLASTQQNQNAYLSPESTHSDAREPLQRRSSVGSVPAVTEISSTEAGKFEGNGLSDSILGIGLQEAEQLLRLFRSDLAAHFPFVIVPDGSVEKLHRLRPVLVMAILVAASFRSLSQQRERAEKLLKYLSLHILLQGEKSLDLLQGLLVFAAWHQCRFSSRSAFTSILQLAAGLVLDLGLNKPPATIDRHNLVLSAINGVHGLSAACHQRRTNEERRALLGCFYLTSVISACFRKFDAIRYTPYIEDCAQVLLAAGEHQGDIDLVAQVRLQHIIESIGQSIPLEESNHSMTTKAPIGLCIKSLRAELQLVKGSLLDLSESNFHFIALLRLHYHIVEIHLYEIGLSDTHNSSYNTHALGRLEIIWACLTALRSFFEAYIAIPTQNYYNLPFSEWVQFAYAIIVLSKLTFLQEDFWDAPFTQQTLDLFEILDQAAARFEEAEKTVTVDGMPIEENGLFSRWARKIRWVKAWYETKLPPGARQMEGAAPAVQLAALPIREDDAMLVDELLAGGLLQDLDDTSWQQLMGDWDAGPFSA
ncbi:hypothetical protein MMC18_006667 [Xylographa bjoerkii]|nr:hypothetical protein [Xylographa bjoerkii]